MNKLFSILFGVLLLLSQFSVVAAKHDEVPNSSDIPEQNGDYQVPDNPGLRVRVFVHNPKPAPSASPLLVCNLDDPDSTAVVAPAGWHLPDGNWTYTLNSSSVPVSVGSANLATIASSAFNQWSNAITNKVVFIKNPTDTTATRAQFDGKNIITWGRTSGTALAVTYIWYYTSNYQVAEVDTIMNKRFPWSWSGNNNGCADTNSYDAQDILTHETGHWLGLDDMYSTNYVNNTLFGYGAKGEIKKDTLTTGDRAGVQAIYP